jgi:hypothetical protein
MSPATRSPERLTAVLTDRPETGSNQRRVDEAFRLLSQAAVRIVSSVERTAFVLDMASRDGVLQEVWCRDESTHAPLVGPPGGDPVALTSETFGAANAERYLVAQKALSALLLELTRPDYCGAASLRLRGWACEIVDDIRGESRRQWQF